MSGFLLPQTQPLGIDFSLINSLQTNLQLASIPEDELVEGDEGDENAQGYGPGQNLGAISPTEEDVDGDRINFPDQRQSKKRKVKR